eukprot:scaffold70121_cov55-Attheya_sp.AAC.1
MTEYFWYVPVGHCVVSPEDGGLPLMLPEIGSQLSYSGDSWVGLGVVFFGLGLTLAVVDWVSDVLGLLTSCNDGTGRSGGARLYTRRQDGPKLLAHWPAPPLGVAAARGGAAGGFLGLTGGGGGGMAGWPPAPRTKEGNAT